MVEVKFDENLDKTSIFMPTREIHQKYHFVSNTFTFVSIFYFTAKVMFGTVGAINELREKEQSEKNSAARAGRRQWFSG